LRAALTDFFKATTSGADAFLVLFLVVFSIRQTAITVREKPATRKREIRRRSRKKRQPYGVTRGSPAGVMAPLVVPSVLLVLIGTCPYFLSTTREIVV
jgi:hypothetical protein